MGLDHATPQAHEAGEGTLVVLPCPYCGHDAKAFVIQGLTGGAKQDWARCANVQCDNATSTTVERWNTRAPAAPLAATENALKWARGALCEASVHYDYGLIPLLQQLQTEHPTWNPESVATALEKLSRGSDERDELEEAYTVVTAALNATPATEDRDGE